MKLANDTVVIQGLHPVMRKAMKVADALWIANGQPEGITITSGMDGIHGANSWHYCGAAIDIRNHYWDHDKKARVHAELKKSLPEYDVILHSTHIHIEPNNTLARQYGLLF